MRRGLWEAGSVGGWLSPALVVLFTIFWSLLVYMLIGNRPTDWKYGVIPYVPAQSVVSTTSVPRGPAPRQVELPTAARRPANER